MARWPRDNQQALIEFYGDPGSGEVSDQLVRVTPPFRMTYDGKPIKTLSFHRKAAPALIAALNKVWDYYGRDQKKIDALGISKTAGTYNPRKVRGSDTKWSNHAFGAAIDINAEENGFNVPGNIPLPVIAAFKSEGARWGGDYKSRKDPMHFEFCASGEPERSFEQWLKLYGCPPMPEPVAPKPAPHPEPEHEAESVPLPRPRPPADDDVEPAPPPPTPVPKPGLLRRFRNWIVGTFGGISGFGFLTYLTDWQVAAVFFAALLLLIGGIVWFLIWLFGKERVRSFLSRLARKAVD